MRRAEELIFRLSERALSVGEALSFVGREDLEYLLNVGVLKREGDFVRLGFCFLLWPDRLKLREIGVRYGMVLADFIVEGSDDVDRRLCKLNCARYADVKLLRFMVIGCYALDLGFLKLLWDRWEIKRKFIPYACEVGDDNLAREMYWGCHDGKFGNYMMYTFGDHAGRRDTFPDLVWSGRERAAMAMEKLHHGEPVENEDALSVLEKYGYIRDGKLVTPFLDRDDLDVALEVAGEVASRAYEFIDQRIDEIREQLNGLRAREWCSFQEIFIEAWHWIFGWANRELVNRGYFAKPETGRDGCKYIKWATILPRPGEIHPW